MYVVFNSWFASYFWEWDVENAFLRAPLAAKGYGLVNLWSDTPVWVLHHMALGKTIGYSARVSQNNNGYYNLYGDPAGQLPPTSFRRGVHMSLMGDPTLRMHMVTPPTTLLAAAHGRRAGQPKLGRGAASGPAGLQCLPRQFRGGTVYAVERRVCDRHELHRRESTERKLQLPGKGHPAGNGFGQRGPYTQCEPGTLMTSRRREFCAGRESWPPPTQVTVVFDQPVNLASAQTAANYQLSGGLLDR